MKKAFSNLLANIKKEHYVINRDGKIVDRLGIMFRRTENGDHKSS